MSNERIRRIVAQSMGHVSGADNSVSEAEFAARTDALLNRYGVRVAHPHRDAHLFRGLAVMDHAREMLRKTGERVPMSTAEVWDRCIEVHRSALTTTDAVGLVENIGRKAVIEGWNASPVSYPQWTRTGTLANLRTESRTGLSAHPVLPAVPEGTHIKVAARSTTTEYVTGSKYASIFRISRPLLLGDEAGALAREPQSFGRAARMTVQKAVTDLLTSNAGVGPTMNQDGIALFDVSTHGNYVSSSGAAPSVTTLDAARKAMRTRTDPTSGEVLNIVPRVLLVPAALETQARTLAQAQNSPLGDQEGDLLVAVDPRLDSVSATAWYLTADGKSFDTIEVAYLDGHAEPIVETMKSWATDGTEFRVSLHFGVAALDWRAMYRNVGA